MRWRMSGLLAAICLSVMSGCQGDNDNKLYQVTGEDPVILVHNLEGGMEMGIVGILAYDSNSKCLYLESPNPNKPSLAVPIWPNGTTPHIDNNRRGVEIPSYGTILEGDTVDAGGGGIERSELADLDVPSGCLDTVEVLVISDLY